MFFETKPKSSDAIGVSLMGSVIREWEIPLKINKNDFSFYTKGRMIFFKKAEEFYAGTGILIIAIGIGRGSRSKAQMESANAMG